MSCEDLWRDLVFGRMASCVEGGVHREPLCCGHRCYGVLSFLLAVRPPPLGCFGLLAHGRVLCACWFLVCDGASRVSSPSVFFSVDLGSRFGQTPTCEYTMYRTPEGHEGPGTHNISVQTEARNISLEVL